MELILLVYVTHDLRHVLNHLIHIHVLSLEKEHNKPNIIHLIGIRPQWVHAGFYNKCH